MTLKSSVSLKGFFDAVMSELSVVGRGQPCVSHCW